MFIVYCILGIIRYFYYGVGDEDAAAVGVGGADLVIAGSI
jgi:hypothetical protein